MDENRIIGDSENERIINLNGNYQSIAITDIDTYIYTSLVIVTPPAITNYYEGDLFNPDELICEAKLTGIHTGEEKSIMLYPSDLTISPDRALLTTDTEITISYTIDSITHTTSYPINVQEATFYTITGNVINGTYDSPETVKQGGTAIFTITANAGYTLPSSIEQFTITGAEGSYNNSTGVLLLSSVTGNVTVTVTCPQGSPFTNPWTDEEMEYFVTTWSNWNTPQGTYNLVNAPMGIANQKNIVDTVPEYANKYIYAIKIPVRCRSVSQYSSDMNLTWGIIERSKFATANPTDRINYSRYYHTETGITLPKWNTVQIKTFIIDQTIKENEMLWFGISTDTVTPIINQGPGGPGHHKDRDFSAHLDSYALFFGATTPATDQYVQPIQFELDRPDDKTLLNIEVATPPTVTSYAVGTQFNPSGMIINAKYMGNSGHIYTVENVEYTYSPTGALTVGDTEITITFSDGGITKTTVQPITVHESSYSISGNITNGTLTGDTEIVIYGNAWVSITPDPGYNIPADLSKINVENATVVDYTNGMLAIKNPSGNVIITAVCAEIPSLSDVWTDEELAEFYDEFNGMTTTYGTYTLVNAPFTIGSFNTFPTSSTSKYDYNILEGYYIHSITMPFRCRTEDLYNPSGMVFTWGILKEEDFSKSAVQRAEAMTNVHQVLLNLNAWNHVENKEIIIDYRLNEGEYLAFGVSTDTISPLINQSSNSTSRWKSFTNHPGYVIMYSNKSLSTGQGYVQPMILNLRQ